MAAGNAREKGYSTAAIVIKAQKDVKSRESVKMLTGKIKRLIYRRGFGFIDGPGGEDLFFHCSGLKNVDFEDLKEGDLISFEIEEGPKGNRAVKVQRIDGKETEKEETT